MAKRNYFGSRCYTRDVSKGKGPWSKLAWKRHDQHREDIAYLMQAQWDHYVAGILSYVWLPLLVILAAIVSWFLW